MPNQLAALSATTTTVPASTPVPATEAQVLISRLDEINAVDKSALNATKKRELRREVRGIKKELKASGNGIYLSTAAVIIIILLLVLLL
ncbi:MAG: hypothetical protein C7N36_21745 [Bacteroidetes bacterium]|nr:MAG: hypothetical protein C7N36_21745 [Bacteroidota bacterium]